jgi:putative membrane protein
LEQQREGEADMKRMGILPLFCAAALVIGCNGRKDTTTVDNRNEPAAIGTAGEAERTAIHDSDKDFINHQLSDGTAEVELAKVAAQKAVNPEVKRFAQMMVQDHEKAGSALKDIAGKFNVTPAPQVDDKHQDLMNKLSKLRGTEFDHEYIKAMVDDHQNAVDSLESRVDSTASLKDKITDHSTADKQVVPEKTENALAASVNEWAATTLPVVRQHLDDAKTINDAMDRKGRVNETARNNKARNEK